MKKYLLIALVASTLATGFLFFFKEENHVIEKQPVESPIGKSNPIKLEAEPKVLTFTESINSINKVDADKWLRYLASDELEGRMSGKKGNKLAAEFCKKKFEEWGYKTEYQKFSIRRVNPGPNNERGDDFTQNVIAYRPGKTDRVIIMGAHLDHVGYGPAMALDRGIAIHNGADDNASGTTGVLLAAQAMSKAPVLEHSVVFLLFSGEEMGLIGSRHYVSELSSDQIRKIDLMVNFDMIGRMKSNGAVECVGARKSPTITTLLQKLEPKYPPINAIPLTGDGEGNSDHAPFYDRGVPVCFFFTGLHPQYHKATDDADLINFDGLVIIAKLGLNLVYEYDREVANRR